MIGAAVLELDAAPSAWAMPLETLSTATIVGAFAWLVLGWLRKFMEREAQERTAAMARESQERTDMREERIAMRDETRRELHSLRNVVNEVSLKNAELDRKWAECETHRGHQEANIRRLESTAAALSEEVRELHARQTERISREHDHE